MRQAYATGRINQVTIVFRRFPTLLCATRLFLSTNRAEFRDSNETHTNETGPRTNPRLLARMRHRGQAHEQENAGRGFAVLFCDLFFVVLVLIQTDGRHLLRQAKASIKNSGPLCQHPTSSKVPESNRTNAQTKTGTEGSLSPFLVTQPISSISSFSEQVPHTSQSTCDRMANTSIPKGDIDLTAIIP